ncbi:MAG: universal stress protein [Acidimicrobiales bacterium]
MFRRILVGYDGSREAGEALRAGTAIAAASSGETTVLIVATASRGETDEDRQASFQAETARIRDGAQAEIRTSGNGHTHVSIHAVASDHPAAALSGYASEHGFDLLVIGRHGRERATHRGIGLVARDLVEKASCPLLLVGNGVPE